MGFSCRDSPRPVPCVRRHSQGDLQQSIGQGLLIPFVEQLTCSSAVPSLRLRCPHALAPLPHTPAAETMIHSWFINATRMMSTLSMPGTTAGIACATADHSAGVANSAALQCRPFDMPVLAPAVQHTSITCTSHVIAAARPTAHWGRAPLWCLRCAVTQHQQ